MPLVHDCYRQHLRDISGNAVDTAAHNYFTSRMRFSHLLFYKQPVICLTSPNGRYVRARRRPQRPSQQQITVTKTSFTATK